MLPQTLCSTAAPLAERKNEKGARRESHSGNVLERGHGGVSDNGGIIGEKRHHNLNSLCNKHEREKGTLTSREKEKTPCLGGLRMFENL